MRKYITVAFSDNIKHIENLLNATNPRIVVNFTTSATTNFTVQLDRGNGYKVFPLLPFPFRLCLFFFRAA